jgi:hypothetical protein|tara:strand:+ start:103 stop:363 length:261 start_codon:yes stop_codon:yes gene_type:complete
MNTQENSNPVLVEVPLPNTELKKWLVDYVGSQHGPGNGEVTVEMIVETVSQEFPEFLLVVAEENFFRGYEQALMDLQEAQDSEQTS